MTHKPNPFDFVPFVESGPNLYPLKEFVESDKLLTGYLKVRIKALTPLHIVGDQEAEDSEPLDVREKNNGKRDFTITKSSFFRREDTALIPSSTIRGCLRSFIEAATNGWVSQFTPYYEKKGRVHKYGFKVDDSVKVQNQKAFDKRISAALNEKYILPSEGSDNIDIPSFLFGYTHDEGNARKGRVIIEDARIADGSLDEDERYSIPDIKDSAFMGGPKPSASSWWYQYPHQIRLSEFKDREGKQQVGVDFIGSGYRGRKFYFHQDPVECVKLYTVHANNWPRRNYHPLYPIPIEYLKPGSETDEFRIYFDEIPESLLKILIFALTPGSPGTERGTPTLRHKLGYGKAYGLGSVEYVIAGGRIRKERKDSAEVGYIEQLQNEVISSLWDFDKFNEIEIGKYLHKINLENLAKILWFDKAETALFRYPSFDNGGFLPVIRKSDLEPKLEQGQRNNLDRFKNITVTRADGKCLAQKLYTTGRRKALHFEVYQENSDNYQKIQGRSIYICK
jgi:hypothetical protein